jgi:hypothetical protein
MDYIILSSFYISIYFIHKLFNSNYLKHDLLSKCLNKHGTIVWHDQHFYYMNDRLIEITQCNIVYDCDLWHWSASIFHGLCLQWACDNFFAKKIYRFFDQNCSLIASFIFYTMVGKFVWKSSLSQNCRLFVNLKGDHRSNIPAKFWIICPIDFGKKKI